MSFPSGQRGADLSSSDISYVLVLWVLGTGEALAHTIGGFFSSSVWIGQLFFHLQSFWEMFQMTGIVPPPYNSLQESNLPGLLVWQAMSNLTEASALDSRKEGTVSPWQLWFVFCQLAHPSLCITRDTW